VALRQANARFARRFRAMERMARERDLDMTAMDIDALESLWQEAKLSA
jgi:ATP diphosphatase